MRSLRPLGLLLLGGTGRGGAVAALRTLVPLLLLLLLEPVGLQRVEQRGAAVAGTGGRQALRLRRLLGLLILRGLLRYRRDAERTALTLPAGGLTVALTGTLTTARHVARVTATALLRRTGAGRPAVVAGGAGAGTLELARAGGGVLAAEDVRADELTGALLTLALALTTLLARVLRRARAGRRPVEVGPLELGGRTGALRGTGRGCGNCPVDSGSSCPRGVSNGSREICGCAFSSLQLGTRGCGLPPGSSARGPPRGGSCGLRPWSPESFAGPAGCTGFVRCWGTGGCGAEA